jgi:hypothetical protein
MLDLVSEIQILLQSSSNKGKNMAHWAINIEFDENASEAEQVKQVIESAALVSHIDLTKAAATAILKQVKAHNA